MPIRTFIVEPIVPHYRVPLFSGLASLEDFQLNVVASRRFPGSPDSVTGLPGWADTSRPVSTMIGGRLYWQHGLVLPADFGRGDVLVIDGNPRFLSNIPLLREARKRGMGVVSWGHAWSPTSQVWRARLRYRYMELADVILVYTDEEAESLKAKRNWKRPILATNNAIDQETTRVASIAWNEERLVGFRESEGLVGRKVMLFCGRLRKTPSTDLHLAIEALAILNQSARDHILVVIGQGELECQYKEHAKAVGVSDSVRWVGAIYEESALAPWFLSASCFVYPGAIGLSLLHAFGYALPVITHDQRSAHNPEISALRHGKNGLLFQRGSASDLAEKVASVLKDPIYRQSLSRAAFQAVQKDYSMDGMIRRFSSALRLASTISMGQRA